MNPLDVACPACQARPGEPCTQPTDNARKAVRWFHLSREGATRKVASFATCQFAWGGLLDATPVEGNVIHLVVRSVDGGGTPGPCLCGLERFGDNVPGWSINGGVRGPGYPTPTACLGCVEQARKAYPGILVEERSLFHHVFEGML